MSEKWEDNISNVEIEEKGGLIVDNGILHILDYNTHTIAYSQSALNTEDTFIKKLCKRLIRKCHLSIERNECRFKHEEALRLVHAYQKNEIPFVDMSVSLVSILDKAIQKETVKGLCVFVFAYHYDDMPYVAVAILEGQSGYLATSYATQNRLVNTIQTTSDLMPNFTKKIPAFLIFTGIGDEGYYGDQMKWDTKTYQTLKEIFQIDTRRVNEKEMYETLHKIVNDVQSESQKDPVRVSAKFKQALQSARHKNTQIITDDLAKELFPTLRDQQAFKAKAEEKNIPKEISVTHASFEKKLSSQKIQTDTGITISYPLAFASNPDMISFEKEEDGSISITIKNIRSITNS